MGKLCKYNWYISHLESHPEERLLGNGVSLNRLFLFNKTALGYFLCNCLIVGSIPVKGFVGTPGGL